MSQYETRPFRRNTIIVPGGPFNHTFLNLFVRIEFSSNLSDNYMHINAIYTPQGHSKSKAWRVEDFFWWPMTHDRNLEKRFDPKVQDQTKHPFRFWLELRDDLSILAFKSWTQLMGSNPPKFPQLQLQKLKIYLKMGNVGSQCLELLQLFLKEIQMVGRVGACAWKMCILLEEKNPWIC